MLTFTNAAEQAAWSMAEALSEKAFAAMKNAEEAQEMFRAGRMAMRRQFKARGLSEVDAAIRWKSTAQAQSALADHEFYMSLASMYNEAAAAQYTKALYLKNGKG